MLLRGRGRRRDAPQLPLLSAEHALLLSPLDGGVRADRLMRMRVGRHAALGDVAVAEEEVGVVQNGAWKNSLNEWRENFTDGVKVILMRRILDNPVEQRDFM